MLEVRRSAVHGSGCFAAQPIAAGELIGRFEGKPVSEDGPHVLWIAGDKGLRITNDLRFLNHSADPNAHTDEATLDLLAQRAIAAGEEITIHYGDEWD